MRKLLCWVFGHQYAEIMRLSDFCHLVGCVRCKKRWGMNTAVHALVEWDMQLEDFHRSMGPVARKRSTKKGI
jgi:hypothetical protein